jgi:hypothetical protein
MQLFPLSLHDRLNDSSVYVRRQATLSPLVFSASVLLRRLETQSYLEENKSGFVVARS